MRVGDIRRWKGREQDTFFIITDLQRVDTEFICGIFPLDIGRCEQYLRESFVRYFSVPISTTE